MARPALFPPRCNIGLLLTAAQRQAVEQMAAEGQQSISAVIRGLIDKAARTDLQRPDDDAA